MIKRVWGCVKCGRILNDEAFKRKNKQGSDVVHLSNVDGQSHCNGDFEPWVAKPDPAPTTEIVKNIAQILADEHYGKEIRELKGFDDKVSPEELVKLILEAREGLIRLDT